jgi:hypothetical protein
VLAEEHMNIIAVEHEGTIMVVVTEKIDGNDELREWLRDMLTRRGVKIGKAPPDFLVEIAAVE